MGDGPTVIYPAVQAACSEDDPVGVLHRIDCARVFLKPYLRGHKSLIALSITLSKCFCCRAINWVVCCGYVCSMISSYIVLMNVFKAST